MRDWLLPTPGAHLVQLDSLRAFAVIGVLVTHYLPRSTTVFQAGFFGVRLFFVLSGFLITGILLRPGRSTGCGRFVSSTHAGSCGSFPPSTWCCC
jgi:peptidoglycan/LPS O-acetylase OafA/YrhL